MEDPKPLSELDFADYAKYLESQGLKNMKIVLDSIVKELMNPF